MDEVTFEPDEQGFLQTDETDLTILIRRDGSIYICIPQDETLGDSQMVMFSAASRVMTEDALFSKYQIAWFLKNVEEGPMSTGWKQLVNPKDLKPKSPSPRKKR
jgi:hypothetical protein